MMTMPCPNFLLSMRCRRLVSSSRINKPVVMTVKDVVPMNRIGEAWSCPSVAKRYSFKTQRAQGFAASGDMEENLEEERRVPLVKSLSLSLSFNSKMNKASKWLAVLLASGVVLWKHDLATIWALIGAVASGGIGRVLKYLINENRPPSAHGIKEDPGMPSSHAQGFAYLGTYASLALLFSHGMQVWTVLGTAAITLGTLYLTWLRVGEGFHTAPQVFVGNTLGCAIAAVWLWLWNAGLGAATEASGVLKACLLATFSFSFVGMYLVGFKTWGPGQA